MIIMVGMTWTWENYRRAECLRSVHHGSLEIEKLGGHTQHYQILLKMNGLWL